MPHSIARGNPITGHVIMWIVTAGMGQRPQTGTSLSKNTTHLLCFLHQHLKSSLHSLPSRDPWISLSSPSRFSPSPLAHILSGGHNH